jgi:MGT family glycosyltransferase
MAKFLLATMPIPGHVNPFTSVAKTLVKRGHSVVWYSSVHFKKKIEATGAYFVPIQSAIDYGDNNYDQHFPGRRGLSGVQSLVFDFEKLFFDPVEGMMRDLSGLIESFEPDVVIGDAATTAVVLLGELGLATTAVLNISVFSLAMSDMPPFGLGLPFDHSVIGRTRNALMRSVTRRLVFGKLNKRFAALRRSLGLPPRPFEPMPSANLYLQPSVPSIEYPVRDIPPQVHFVGALLPETPLDFKRPTWWQDMLLCEKPVVHVTQGTVATEAGELIEPTIRALANEDVLLIVTTGGKPVESVMISTLPANVRIEPFIPHTLLLPHVDVMVTNGGFGAVTQALAHGIPMVIAGMTEDKPEVAARIAYHELGVNLKTQRPTTKQIGAAVKQIIQEPKYTSNAVKVRAEFKRYGGAAQAADLLERLAATRKPVLRGA